MHSVNYFKVYEELLKTIRTEPDNPEPRHQAVLALARAGSLDFALSEYKRYGLDKIRHHEDIMALGGRLYKDLFLASSGGIAREHALCSSEKYEAAYKDTGGYYSGINAATMALVGGMPIKIVKGRAQEILRKLPTIDDLSKEELYFVEATRAEAYLLLDNDDDAANSLRRALAHDPLSYTSHASTLRQFSMICKFRSKECDWLAQFSPPKPAYFSGHLFSLGRDSSQTGVISEAAQSDLKNNISDTVQRHDIGFGFGALAAGSDILIAETLMDEGCELHVVLPVAMELFVEHSVAPFGQVWVERFQVCIDKANSLSIATQNTSWPSSGTDKFSRSIAMGKAVMQADMLAVEAVQLLVWDGKRDASWTAKTAAEWSVYGRAQYIIPYNEPRPLPHKSGQHSNSKHLNGVDESDGQIKAMLCCDDVSELTVFDNINAAVLKALDLRASYEPQRRIGIHMGTEQNIDKVAAIARMLSDHAVPNSILVSDTVASHLAFHCSDLFDTNYIGQVSSAKHNVRAFALKPKGKYASSI